MADRGKPYTKIFLILLAGQKPSARSLYDISLKRIYHQDGQTSLKKSHKKLNITLFPGQLLYCFHCIVKQIPQNDAQICTIKAVDIGLGYSDPIVVKIVVKRKFLLLRILNYNLPQHFQHILIRNITGICKLLLILHPHIFKVITL